MTEACRHCGRTSHGFACCGTLGCNRDHTATTGPDLNRPWVCTLNHDHREHADEARKVRHLPRPQHGPTPPRRPVRRIDPKGTR